MVKLIVTDNDLLLVVPIGPKSNAVFSYGDPYDNPAELTEREAIALVIKSRFPAAKIEYQLKEDGNA